jgi:hypothetical protein
MFQRRKIHAPLMASGCLSKISIINMARCLAAPIAASPAVFGACGPTYLDLSRRSQPRSANPGQTPRSGGHAPWSRSVLCTRPLTITTLGGGRDDGANDVMPSFPHRVPRTPHFVLCLFLSPRPVLFSGDGRGRGAPGLHLNYTQTTFASMACQPQVLVIVGVCRTPKQSSGAPS